MSLPIVRKIFETELADVSAVATVHENEAYSPVAGTPYQACFVLCAQPANIEIGPAYDEQGVFQVNLFYPKDQGTGNATAQAELIRDHFPFGATFSDSGVTVYITSTTEIAPARAEDDRFMVPVKVRWLARIGG